MQFVRRGDLHTAVMERRLDRAEIVQSIVDAANALHAAHEIGLVHRDVSPSNILLGEHGALLSDFDLVKAPWTTQGTRTGAWMGKIIFGAPEILQGGAADAAERADVYGLAMSAVFAFHGGELPLQTMGNPQAFVERLDESRVLKNVLKAAVEINPEQRTPTILAFRDAFSLATLKKPHEAPYAGNGRILVVDDQRNMRTTLAIILGDAGYEVVEAYDGEHARDAINSDAFDLVITDLRMGGLDGIEVLRHAKAFAPATEVIIMTAFGTIESAVEAILLGARDYIQKPFTEDELLRKVTKVFERSQRSEARAATKSKEPSDLAR